MLEIKDIEHLSKLARIELSEEEKKNLLKEVGPILGYVSQIKEVAAASSAEKKAGEHRNVSRPDADPFPSGTYAEKIIADFPEKKDGYLEVKKIL